MDNATELSELLRSVQGPFFSEADFFTSSDKDADSSDDQDPNYNPDQDLVTSLEQKTSSTDSSTSSDSVDNFSLNKNHPSSSYQTSLSLSGQNYTVTPTQEDSLSFLTNNIFSFSAGNPMFSLNQRYNAFLSTSVRKKNEKQKKLKGGVKNFMDFLQQYYKVTGKPKHKVPRKELYEHYEEYCANNEYPVISLCSVSRFLGKQKVRANASVRGYRVYVGLKRLDKHDSDASSSSSSEPDLYSVSTLPLPDPYFSLVTQPLHDVFFPKELLCPPDSVYRYATFLRLQQEGVMDTETTEWRYQSIQLDLNIYIELHIWQYHHQPIVCNFTTNIKIVCIPQTEA